MLDHLRGSVFGVGLWGRWPLTQPPVPAITEWVGFEPTRRCKGLPWKASPETPAEGVNPSPICHSGTPPSSCEGSIGIVLVGLFR